MNQRNIIFRLSLALLFFFIAGCGENHAPANQSSPPVARAEVVPAGENLNAEEAEFLLRLARRTLEAYLENKSLPQLNLNKVSPNLRAMRGCFVTLEKNHQLRGCIGYLQPREPLAKAVMQNAVSAAVRDHRFPPVTRSELDSLSIEISVLSVPRLMDHKSPEELLARLVPERDGVILKSSYHQSTYLPQVWKQLPKKEEFLSRLCVKGGAKADCWKDSSTKIYSYQAKVYSEE